MYSFTQSVHLVEWMYEVSMNGNAKSTSELYLKEQNFKFSRHLVTFRLMESQKMFNSPGNISGASQLNSVLLNSCSR